MHASSTSASLSSRPPLELWGGVECTVNRVGDRYFDQTARTGHRARLEDLDRFAELGLRTLRFPLLWEHVQPERERDFDWRWPDLALDRMRELGLRPIVGLLHHGFGPAWIDPRAPEFAEEFASYARAVAERYPWIDAYTPVNEPLTTARFSGLYGHWHPHARDDATFARLFIAQLSATVGAMREIRRVSPGAKLVQTEDLGKVASTPALEWQRDFENERRWLSWDALSGRVTSEHACWEYMVGSSSVNERVLCELAADPCPPQLIGINHYITSERYLDERVERYALDEIGGNGCEVYADVAQVQVGTVKRAGLRGLLRETWDRYRIPIAVTECHIGCTREEQMRWLGEIWSDADDARRDSIDVRAVTSWALLGSYDWNSLVTRESDHYEPGAFDARGAVPRPTALAAMVRALATEGQFEHSVLDTQGWWHRDRPARVAARPILIVESMSEHDRMLIEGCESRGLAFARCDRTTLHSAAEVARLLDTLQPWAAIDMSDYSTALVEECTRRGIPLLSGGFDTFDVNAALDSLIDDSVAVPESSVGRSAEA